MIYNLTSTPSQGLIRVANSSSYQQSLPAHATPSSHRTGVKSATASDVKRNGNPKRKQVKNACVNCQKACKKCDDGRACQRCIKLGLTATCVDSPRKERRKGMKRGPYKKRQQDEQTLEESDVPNAVLPSCTSASTAPANGFIAHGIRDDWYYTQENPFGSSNSSNWSSTNPAYMVPQRLSYTWVSSQYPEMLAYDQSQLYRDMPLTTTTINSSSNSSPSSSPTTPSSLPVAYATDNSSGQHHSSSLPAQQYSTVSRNNVLGHHQSPRAAVSDFKSTMPLLPSSGTSVHVEHHPYNYWPADYRRYGYGQQW